VSTVTSQPKFDSYSEETTSFTHEQKAYAQELVWACEDKIDRLWFDMFDKVQKDLGLNAEDTYLLIQKAQYRG